MKKLLLGITCLLTTTVLFAKDKKDSTEIALERQLKLIDSIENALKWETNTVTLGDGFAKLHIAEGYKFLNVEQSKYVLHDLWGNPPQEDVLGMIFPAAGGPFADSSYAFLVSFDESGYIKDEDADKIDYDDMLKEIQKGEADVNAERKKEGYEAIHLVGWASKPYYDKQNKILHWAKELEFGGSEDHTLNYDVRVLGRKGVLSLNAIASVSELPLVRANINSILKMPAFTDGNKYSDFNSSTDKVAEYGLGALVAGGVLAKTGVLSMIGKFFIAAWKFIIIGVVAAWGAIKKFFTGKKKDDEVQEELPAEV